MRGLREKLLDVYLALDFLLQPVDFFASDKFECRDHIPVALHGIPGMLPRQRRCKVLSRNVLTTASQHASRCISLFAVIVSGYNVTVFDHRHGGATEVCILRAMVGVF